VLGLLGETDALGLLGFTAWAAPSRGFDIAYVATGKEKRC
jgi:hypothetical protein